MTSLLVHVVGAGLWVGGLAAICWLAASRRPDLGVALPRFSAMALGCFVAVALSGVLNAAIRLGRVEALWQDRYGLLVIGKALLLVVLGGFGYRHRRQTVGPAVAGERRAFARLAGVELAFMAAAFGLAVALSRSPTPVARSVPDVSVAKAALGYELPGPASARTLALSWEPQLLFVLLVLAGAVGYVLGLRRLRARGEFWSGWRSTAWAAGLLVVLVATQSGLSRYGGVLFSVHIVQQMLLALVAPPLLVLGAPVALALRTLPVNSTGYRGARGWLRAALRSSTLRLLTRPFVALGLLLASTFALYFSAVFEALMRQHADHLAMELYFLVLGCLAFWPILGSEAMPHRPRRGLRLLSAALILPGYAAFGLALRSASSPLAVGWFGQLGRTWGASVLADQRTGATLVLVIGAATAIGTALAAWRSASESIGPRSSDSTVEPARIRA